MTTATLSADIQADVLFDHQIDPDGQAEIEILDVLPFGIVPPTVDLIGLAYRWLHRSGGYETCCRLANEQNGVPGHGWN